MTKKFKGIFLSTTLVILSAPIFVASCSKQLNYDFSTLEKIVPQIGTKILPIFQFNKTKNTIKINDLDKNNEFTLNWKINPNVSDKNEIDELNSLLNKVNIKYSHYLLPSINNDGKSNLFFDIELKENSNAKTKANIIFEKLSTVNNLSIENLNDLELQELIKTKMNDNLGLNTNINNIIENYFMSNKNYFIANNFTKNNLFNELLELIKKEISIKIKSFNTDSQYLLNLFFVNNLAKKSFLTKESSTESYKKYNISLLISTSENDVKNHYEFNIPFNLDYDINEDFLK